MKVQTSISRNHNNKSKNGSKDQKKDNNQSAYQIEDNRPESISQRKLNEIVGKKTIAKQLNSIIQCTRMSKGIEYAISDEDAVEWLSSNVSNWSDLPEIDRETAMDVAQNKELGVSIAKGMLEGSEFEKSVTKRKEARAIKVLTDFRMFEDSFGDDLANSIFSVMKSAYVGGNKNVSIAKVHTQNEVDNAINAMGDYLDKGNLTENITNVHFFRRQNKAAAGKGRVGDTLAKREIQANFIATWFGATVNVHVDIDA